MLSFRHFKISQPLIVACFILAGNLLSSPASGRTWTSANGEKTFEGELEAFHPATGVVHASINGETKIFYESILSDADQRFLKQYAIRVRQGIAEKPKDLPKITPKRAQKDPPAREDEKPKEPTNLVIPDKAVSLIDFYCIDCHEDGTEKGGIRLDNLKEQSIGGWIDILNKMQEQVFLEQMPPKDGDVPTNAERSDLLAWLSKELGSLNASTLEGKLKQPNYGNYVNHEKLFSGEYAKLQPYTPDRRWLISEFIFNQKFAKLLRHNATRTIDGKRVKVRGDSNIRRVTFSNPFLLPSNSGVRYYDNTLLNGGHFLTMISNSKAASQHMLWLSRRGQAFPAIRQIMEQEWKHQSILKKRKDFMNIYTDRLAADIYKHRNDSLLPRFVSLNIQGTEGDVKNKTAFHTVKLSNEEMKTIYFTYQKFNKKNLSEDQKIEACEKHWFNYGHNPRKIRSRVTLLKNYMKDWKKNITQYRYAERNKQLKYDSIDQSEIQLIGQSIVAHRKKGDSYRAIIEKCLATWNEEFKAERVAAGTTDDDKLSALITELFREILERAPTEDESSSYLSLMKSYLEKQTDTKAVQMLIETVILRSEFVYRSEFGEGNADQHGRKMLSPRDASFAIAYALTDSSPDNELRKAAENGKLETRADYEREVKRMLKKRDQVYIIDEAVEKIGLTASFTKMPIRELRFFREFFAYPNMLPIFKDNKRFGGDYTRSTGRLVGEADQLVEHILEKDKNVFEELLTTEDFYVFHSGDNEKMAASSKRIHDIYHYFKDKDWENMTVDELRKHKPFIDKMEMRGIIFDHKKRSPLIPFKTAMKSFAKRFKNGGNAMPFDSFPAHGKGNADTRYGGSLRGAEVAKFFNLDMTNWDYQPTQPTKMANRKGMLTHPAWLIAHSLNTETDPVIRGKWVREKLLAGRIPDIPITVDAVVPEDHTKTMRDRLSKVTEVKYCWKCHEGMNPLGYTFEMYDDFGRFRMEEFLEHPDNLIEERPSKGKPEQDLRDLFKTLPVNPKGHLAGTGDPKLDGDVKDAIELAERLGKSDRVRQSIIRYAFRYFIGRNEFLSDSKTLIEAEQAYLKSGGSFDALVVSLLTSDSFIYRKPVK